MNIRQPNKKKGDIIQVVSLLLMCQPINLLKPSKPSQAGHFFSKNEIYVSLSLVCRLTPNEDIFFMVGIYNTWQIKKGSRTAAEELFQTSKSSGNIKLSFPWLRRTDRRSNFLSQIILDGKGMQEKVEYLAFEAEQTNKKNAISHFFIIYST